MKNKLTALCTSIILLSPFTVQAEDLAEIIVTGSRVAEARTASPGSWSALDEKTLSAIGHVHIQQALERLPGVNLHRNNGQEYLPAVRSPVLTGSGACGSFLMAEDGIPLRPAGFCNINELFESHSEQASRIEVARGAAVALYGSNAMHGIINVISPADLNRSNSIALDAGPSDYHRLRLHLKQNNTAVALTTSHDGGYRDDSGVDQQKLSIKHRKQFDNVLVTSGISAVNLNQETAGYILGKDNYKDDSLSKTNPNPEAYRDAWAVRLWSRIEDSNFADGSDKPSWVITPYFRSSQMNFLQHFLPGNPLEQNGQQSLGLQSAFYRYGEQSTLIAGLDLEAVDGWLKQSQDGATQGSLFLQTTIPAGQHYDYTVTGIQASPFVQWQYELTPKTSITTGLRYEFMRYDYDNRMLDGRTRDDGTACGFGGCRYSRPADQEDSFNNWSPSISLQHQLSDNQTLTLLLSRSHRVPQVVELYRLQREQQIADLDSETMDSIEINLHGVTEHVRYEVAAYAMDKENVIFRDSDFFTISDGKTRHYGLEGALSAQLTDTLDLGISATFARHQYNHHRVLSGVDLDGQDVDSAPRVFGSVQLGWTPTQTVRVELDWQHMGKYYTDPENLHSYDGHDLVHLRGQWALNDHVKLNLNLLNLLDKDYAKRADYTSFGGDRYFPGEPRSLHVGVKWTW